MRFSMGTLHLVLTTVLAVCLSGPAHARGCAGKSGAPVTIAATVTGNTARVTVTANRPASNLSIRFHGTDGLAVRGNASPVEARPCRAGEAFTLDVDFVPGSGYCLLVVTVEGTFGGRPSSRVVSYAAGSLQGRLKSAGTVKTTPTGTSVQELPATTVRYRRVTP